MSIWQGMNADLIVTVLADDAVNRSIIWESSNPEIISVDAPGRLTAHALGSAVITATAQDGSLVCGSCTVYCDTYLYSLVNLFGFEKEVAFLIRGLYNKVDDIFADETEMQRAWKCARLLGGIIYGSNTSSSHSKLRWENVAGKVSSNDERYFIDVLGYSQDEYSQIAYAIYENYGDSSTPDFAHMQISLAARLAYKLDLDKIMSNIGTISSDEKVSYLAGWLGDAVLPEANGTTSIGNDDYCSDLDSENIYRIILTNMSSVDAFNEYYYQIFAGANRAEIFLGYISYEYVEVEVFYALVDIGLISSMSAAQSANNVGDYLYYQMLLNDEEYHWQKIKGRYPDTYDFLNSLKDCLANMAHYE